jgi:hypothetical protein
VNRDEIQALAASQNIPQPPAGASDGLKRDDLSLRLLAEITCQLADLNEKLTKGTN